MVPGGQYHAPGTPTKDVFVALGGGAQYRKAWNPTKGTHYLQTRVAEPVEEPELYTNMMKSFRRNLTRAIEGIDLYFGGYVGADPEIFVQSGGGDVIPAWEILPAKPKGSTDQAAFWDGVQCEFTTYPNSCLAYHTDSVREGLKLVIDAARRKDRKARLLPINAVEVPEIVLGAPEKYVVFGCAPSKNAYDLKGELAGYRELMWRFAGSHMHFGRQIYPSEVVEAVKAIDAIAGVGLVSLIGDEDLQVRRQYYGLPGEYRLPKWGLEWRVPSAWILRHPVVYHMAFDLARIAYGLGVNGVRRLWEASEAEVVRCIRLGDVGLARKILSRNRELLKVLLERIYTDEIEGMATHAATAWMSGARATLQLDLDNPEEAWRLNRGQYWQTHSDGNNGCFLQYYRAEFGEGESDDNDEYEPDDGDWVAEDED